MLSGPVDAGLAAIVPVTTGVWADTGAPEAMPALRPITANAATMVRRTAVFRTNATEPWQESSANSLKRDQIGHLPTLAWVDGLTPTGQGNTARCRSD